MDRWIINELRLRHYRAFSDCRLKLDDVTFLVGRNGAGKSTLMDALSFMSEAVSDSLGTALERRGNFQGILQRQFGLGARHEVSLAVKIVRRDRPTDSVVYGFRIGLGPYQSSFIVKEEVFDSVVLDGFKREGRSFQCRDSKVQPVIDSDSLAFPLIAGSKPGWTEVIEAIRSVSAHQFSPQAIRSEPRIGSEPGITRDGSNVGDVLKRTRSEDLKWVEKHLSAMVPGVQGVRSMARVGRRVIVFDQRGEGGHTTSFDASVMSDGTVRSLAILLSIRQSPRPSIVLLDEIEDSLHPYAHGVLLDAIEEASAEFPVVVSTHNPEILSHPVATGERIRIVDWKDGASQVYRLSTDVLAAMKPPMNVGQLLRSNALWTEAEPCTTGTEADFFRSDWP